MYNYTIPYFNNVLRDIPARNLDDNVLQAGENIVFEDSTIKQRHGVQLFPSSSLPLQQITGLSLYVKLRDIEQYLVALTTTDIYVYDAPANKFKLKTRNYFAGTVTSSGTGNRTATLNVTTYTPKGTFATGSKLVNLSSASNIQVGMTVSGTGIATGTRIIDVYANSILLDRKTTASGTNVSLTIKAAFDTAWTAQGLYKISYDSADITLCSTWYTVTSINGSTGVATIANTKTPPSKTASVYCLRLCYDGDMDDQWHIAYPYDPDLDERIIIATNGIDKVQVWNSEGSFRNFIEYDDRCRYVGFFGSVGYEHILYGSTYSDANINLAQTVDYSLAGSLDYSGYFELLDSNSPVTGLLSLQDMLVIYKYKSISLAKPNASGGNDDPFIVQQDIVRNIGTPSIRTVCDLGQQHIFFSGDNIYIFNGMQVQAIGTGNIQYILRNLNKSYEHRSFAFTIPEKNLYCLFLPFKPSEYCNVVIVYNYKDNTWTYWKFSDKDGAALCPSAYGYFIKTYAPTWNDLIMTPTGDTTINSNVVSNISSMTGIELGMRIVGAGIHDISYITGISGSTVTIDHNATATATGVSLNIGWTAAQMPQRWSDFIVNENFSRMILGDVSGYLYEFSSENTTDTGNNIVATMTTKDMPLNKPEFDFRLLELVMTMERLISDTGYYTGSMDVRASIDFGRNWSAWVTVPLDGHEPYQEKKVNFNMVGKQVRFEVRFSTPLVIEGMRIGFNAQYKSMKFDS